MIKMGSEEARASWGTTLDRAFAGEEIVVQRHRRPIVSMVSYDRLQALKKRLALFEALQEAEDELEKMDADPSALLTTEDLCERYGMDLAQLAT